MAIPNFLQMAAQGDLGFYGAYKKGQAETEAKKQRAFENKLALDKIRLEAEKINVDKDRNRITEQDSLRDYDIAGKQIESAGADRKSREKIATENNARAIEVANLTNSLGWFNAKTSRINAETQQTQIKTQETLANERLNYLKAQTSAANALAQKRIEEAKAEGNGKKKGIGLSLTNQEQKAIDETITTAGYDLSTPAGLDLRADLYKMMLLKAKDAGGKLDGSAAFGLAWPELLRRIEERRSRNELGGRNSLGGFNPVAEMFNMGVYPYTKDEEIAAEYKNAGLASIDIPAGNTAFDQHVIEELKAAALKDRGNGEAPNINEVVRKYNIPPHMIPRLMGVPQ